MSDKCHKALAKLRAVLAHVPQNEEICNIIAAQQDVLAHYQPIFSKDHVFNITEEEFKSFLHFENNKHWTGLLCQGGKLTADMSALRQALFILLDENRPIAERYDEAIKKVKGLGRATATAILLVAYPDRYGVWNKVSEDALKRLEIWPEFDRGMTEGQRYAVRFFPAYPCRVCS
jgi:hypothetical protein